MKNSSAIAYVTWNPILAYILDRSPYSHHEFMERHSQQNSYTDPTGGTNVKTGHITTDDLSKLLPSGVDATAYGSLGSRVVNQTYRVRNPANNRVSTCTVVDFGVSNLRGEWFEVEFDDESTSQITRNEMEEILAFNQHIHRE